MDRRIKDRKAMVLVTVVIFTIIISILAVSVLFIMTNEARITENQVDRIQAHYAAQAGIQRYLDVLRINPSPAPESRVINGIPVTIELFSPPNADPSCTVQCECPQGDQSVDCIRAVATY